MKKRYTEKLGQGGLGSQMEKLQHPINSVWLYYTIEQGGRVIETVEQKGRAYGIPLNKEGNLANLHKNSLCRGVVFRPSTAKGRKLQCTFSAYTVNILTWTRLCHFLETNLEKALPFSMCLRH